MESRRIPIGSDCRIESPGFRIFTIKKLQISLGQWQAPVGLPGQAKPKKSGLSTALIQAINKR
jgi:hypothetical protein